MAVISCLNESDPNIKALIDAYGVVLTEKILSKFPDTIPTVKQARSFAEAITGSTSFTSPEIIPNKKTQKEIVDEVRRRWENISKEYFTDEEKGLYERYQTKDGQVRLRRVTDLSKKLFEGKRGKEAAARENERPNNKLTRELGTEMHLLMQGLVYDRIQKSSLLTAAVHPDYAPLSSKPNWMSASAFTSLNKGADRIIENFEKRQKALNEKLGKTDKATIFLEAVLDNQKDLAGTVDVMAVYSDGKLDIYDHKFTRPNIIKREGDAGIPIYEESYDLADVKRKGYRLQMSGYRGILRDAYKIPNEQILKTTILPWFMDISQSDTVFEDGTPINKADMRSKRRKLLKNVNTIKGIGDTEVTEQPSGYQLTENPVLDSVLLKLFDKLEFSTTQAAKNYYSNPEISQKFSEEAHLLERTIAEVQLEKDIGAIVRYVNNVSDWVLNNSDTIEPNYLSQLYLEMNTYDDIISNVSELNKLLTDEELKDNTELKKEMARNILTIGEAKVKIMQTKTLLESEIENNLKLINPDIDKAGPRDMFRKLAYFSEINDPLFNTAYRLISEQEDKVKSKIDALVTEAIKLRDKLKEVGLKEAYRAIKDPKTGNAISKFDREFKKKEREAEEDNDIAYLKSIYKITDEGKKRYQEDKKKAIRQFEILYNDNPDMQNLKIEQWIANNNLEKNDLAWTNRWARYKYTELKDIEKHYSPEYKALTGVYKEFYDWLFEKNKEFDKLVGERIRGNFLSNVKRDAIDLLTDGLNSGTPAQIFQIIKNHSTKILQLRKSDYQHIENDPNEEDFMPPVLYMDNFEYWDKDLGDWKAGYTKNEVPIEKSEDLIYNLILFGESVYRANAMNEIKTTLDNMRAYASFRKTPVTDKLGNLKLNQFTNEPELAVNADNIKDFNNMLRMQVRKESITTPDKLFKLGNKTYSTNRIMGYVYNLVRHVALAFNWVPALAGGLNGLSNIAAFSYKNKYFTNKEFRKSMSFSITQYKSFDAISKYFSIERENYTEREARSATKGFIAKLFTKDTAYGLYRVPEEYNSNLIAMSMAQHYGIDSQTNTLKKLEELPEGTKSIFDILKDGIENNKLEADILPQNIFSDFRAKARSVSRLSKGTNVDADKSLAHGDIYLKAVMMFRNWIQPLTVTRLRGATYDPTLEEVEIGRIRVLFGELLNSGKIYQGKFLRRYVHHVAMSTPILGNLLSKSTNGRYKVSDKATLNAYTAFLQQNPQHKGRVSLQEFNRARQAEIQAMHAELRGIVMIAGLLALLTMDSDDDNERDSASNPFANVIYTLTDRWFTEATFFYNYNSFLEITKNAVPGSFIFGRIFNLIGNFFDEFGDDLFGEDDLSKTGKVIDKQGRFYNFFRMFPGVAPGQKLLEVITTGVEEELDE